MVLLLFSSTNIATTYAAVPFEKFADFSTLANTATADNIYTYMNNQLGEGRFDIFVNNASGGWKRWSGGAYNSVPNYIHIKDQKLQIFEEAVKNNTMEKFYFKFADITEGNIKLTFDMSFESDIEGKMEYFIALLSGDLPKNSGYTDATMRRAITISDKKLYDGWDGTPLGVERTAFTAGTYTFEFAGNMDTDAWTVKVTKDGTTKTLASGTYTDVSAIRIGTNSGELTSGKKIYNGTAADGTTKTLEYFIDNVSFKHTPAPKVMQISVADNETEVGTLENISIVFSSPFELANLAGINIKDADNNDVTLTRAISVDKYEYKVTPQTPFTLGETYTLNIPAGLTAINGLSTTEAKTVTFTVAKFSLKVADYTVAGELTKDSPVKVSTTVENTGILDRQDATIIVGCFDSSHKLLKVFSSAESLTLNEAKSMEVSFTAPENISYIKIFAWDSLKRLEPMDNVTIYPDPQA